MIDRTAPSCAALPKTTDIAPEPMTPLLVDDNKTFIAAVRQFVDRMPGVRVVGHAHDGKSALARQREHHPALVLLDIGMPGMNGLELARAMLQDRAPPQRVLLSMHDNREYRAAAPEAPVVLVRGSIGEDAAVDAVLHGAGGWRRSDAGTATRQPVQVENQHETWHRAAARTFRDTHPTRAPRPDRRANLVWARFDFWVTLPISRSADPAAAGPTTP